MLDRLQRDLAIVSDRGAPSQQFQLQWQTTMEAIEAQLLSLQEQLDLIQAAQDAADAANTAAAAADAAAAAAQDAADGASGASSLATSGVTGLTMTASDAGTNATITISAHTRIYGDGTSVSVSGGTVLALAYSTGYYVYYDDPSRAGGTVTYLATTSAATAAQTGDRHSLGAVTTPAGGGGPIDGNINLPPGVVEP